MLIIHKYDEISAHPSMCMHRMRVCFSLSSTESSIESLSPFMCVGVCACMHVPCVGTARRKSPVH